MCYILKDIYPSCNHRSEAIVPTGGDCAWRPCRDLLPTITRQIQGACPSCQAHHLGPHHQGPRRNSIFPPGHDAFQGQPAGQEDQFRAEQAMAYRNLQDQERGQMDAIRAQRNPEMKQEIEQDRIQRRRERINQKAYYKRLKTLGEKMLDWQMDVARKFQG